MAMLPGWNSIEATSDLHDVFEIAGIIILALLVFAEIAAYAYGHRRDELIAADASAALAERQNAEKTAQSERNAAEESIRRELAAAQTEAGQARIKSDQLDKRAAPRSISSTQRAALIKALAPFTGQSVSIESILGDQEGKAFAAEFVSVFHTAGWVVDTVSENSYDVNPVGLQVAVNQAEANAGRIPQAVKSLVETLADVGLTAGKTLHVSPHSPVGKILFRVGRKHEGN